jgi:hypothetical protein
MTKCKEVLPEKKIKLRKSETAFYNLQNLTTGLQNTIQELCAYRVLMKGFKLKCNNCSSKFWYHIEEVGETVKCKGCLQRFELPIEPCFSYKLNDLIKNNLFQSKSQRDGNLTVIRTLIYLYNQSHMSFEYTPQLNLYTDFSRKPDAEIDILCLVDGMLTIGEAKYNSKGFFENGSKCLNSLVEIAKAIRPDKIILSCCEDQPNKLENAKKSLIRLFKNWEHIPKIETHIMYTPDYFRLGSHKYFWRY